MHAVAAAAATAAVRTTDGVPNNKIVELFVFTKEEEEDLSDEEKEIFDTSKLI